MGRPIRPSSPDNNSMTRYNLIYVEVKDVFFSENSVTKMITINNRKQVDVKVFLESLWRFPRNLRS